MWLAVAKFGAPDEPALLPQVTMRQLHMRTSGRTALDNSGIRLSAVSGKTKNFKKLGAVCLEMNPRANAARQTLLGSGARPQRESSC